MLEYFNKNISPFSIKFHTFGVTLGRGRQPESFSFGFQYYFFDSPNEEGLKNPISHFRVGKGQFSDVPNEKSSEPQHTAFKKSNLAFSGW